LIRWNGVRWKARRDGVEGKKALGRYLSAAAVAAVLMRRLRRE
jgi:hypothetical protein